MQHKDIVKAAKELNQLAGTTFKVVAVKGAELQKAIQDIVPTLTSFDFSTLSNATLDVLDVLKCEMPDELEQIKGGLVEENEEKLTEELSPDPIKDNVIPMNKEFTTDEALIAAAEDLIDVLGLPPDDIVDFMALSSKGKIKELQKMADVINEPYDSEDGEVKIPDDKPEDFKPETISVFENNNIKVKWNGAQAVKEKTTKETKLKGDPKSKKEIELQFHKYADLFPETDEETRNTIIKDMQENGFREDRPIILYGGKIADGRTRYACAKAAGVNAFYTNFNGTETELFKHVIALNLKRRHLTPAQRATLAAELLPEFEKVGKEKQKAGGKGKKSDTKFRAAEEAAKATGSTKEAVTTANKVKKKDPKAFEEMKKGKKTIAAAKRETEEKTAIEKFEEAERVMKAKFRMAQTAIHEYQDAAELAEVKEIEFENDLVFIDDTIQKILDK